MKEKDEEKPWAGEQGSQPCLLIPCSLWGQQREASALNCSELVITAVESAY